MEIYVEDPKSGDNVFRKVGKAIPYPLKGKSNLLDKLKALSAKHKGLHYLLFSLEEEALLRADIGAVMGVFAPKDADEAAHFLKRNVCKHQLRPKSLRIQMAKVKILGDDRFGFAFNTPTE